MRNFKQSREQEMEFVDPGDGGLCSRKRPWRSRSARQPPTNDREESSEEEEDPAEDEENATDERTNGPVSWIVSDPELLDCPICFEPLTIPVFQVIWFSLNYCCGTISFFCSNNLVILTVCLMHE